MKRAIMHCKKNAKNSKEMGFTRKFQLCRLDIEKISSTHSYGLRSLEEESRKVILTPDAIRKEEPKD